MYKTYKYDITSKRQAKLSFYQGSFSTKTSAKLRSSNKPALSLHVKKSSRYICKNSTETERGPSLGRETQMNVLERKPEEIITRPLFVVKSVQQKPTEEAGH